MVLVNYTTRELTAKLVYYGPGLCGKTTNLQYVYDALLPDDRRGKMVSLATETDRTLFFDFLPLEIGTIKGLKTRLQLYTVPGQVHYNATRKIVLKGADGIVFVADSQRSMKEANKESFKNMKDNLAEHGLDLKAIPHVLQFNKRDLPDVMPVEEMFEDLNEHNVPFWESVAFQGVGVEDTLKSVTKLVLKNLATRFAPEDAAGLAQDAPSAAPAAEVAAPVPEAQPVAAAPIPAEPVAAEPARAAAQASPFGDEPAAPAAESPLMTSTGELLALEFDGGGGTPVPAGGDDELLEVGEDALVLEDEPTGQEPTVPEPLDSPFGSGDAPAAPEPHAPGPLAEAPAVVASNAENPLGQAEEPPPEAAVIDDAASALDGLELGTPLTGVEPGPAAPVAAAPPMPAIPDAGETVAMPSEVPPPDLEMPGLDGAASPGDTVLSPVGDIEGLATEADLPGAAAHGLDEAPNLDDVPELPGMDGPPPPLAAKTAPELPSGPSEPGPTPEQEVAALAAEDGAIDVPATLNLGAVAGAVEKTLRMPVEWTDASGAVKTRTLEVKLRFKLD